MGAYAAEISNCFRDIDIPSSPLPNTLYIFSHYFPGHATMADRHRNIILVIQKNHRDICGVGNAMTPPSIDPLNPQPRTNRLVYFYKSCFTVTKSSHRLVFVRRILFIIAS
jgi:hypothetical protein